MRCCGSQKYKETLERGNGASRLLRIVVQTKHPGLEVPKLPFTERLDGTTGKLSTIRPVSFIFPQTSVTGY